MLIKQLQQLRFSANWELSFATSQEQWDHTHSQNSSILSVSLSLFQTVSTQRRDKSAQWVWVWDNTRVCRYRCFFVHYGSHLCAQNTRSFLMRLNSQQPPPPRHSESHSRHCQHLPIDRRSIFHTWSNSPAHSGPSSVLERASIVFKHWWKKRIKISKASISTANKVSCGPPETEEHDFQFVLEAVAHIWCLFNNAAWYLSGQAVCSYRCSLGWHTHTWHWHIL